MKKFLLLALCAISAISAFAEPFSKEKFSSLKNWAERAKYAKNSQISADSLSSLTHMNSYFYYYAVVQKEILTTQQILKEAQKFKGLPQEKFELGVANAYARFGHEKEVIEKYQQLKNKQIIAFFIDSLIGFKQFDKVYEYANKYNLNDKLFLAAKKQRDENKIWKYGKQLLLVKGGYRYPSVAYDTLNTMFRYKPESVAKEQQIEFLSKLAQMYPVPGTDFSQWKNFMGFVGFKYKALTGKELF